MIRQFITLLFLICAFNTFGQSLEDFKADFKKALNENFSGKELNKMFQTHSTFLTPHSNVTQLMSSIKGERIEPYLDTAYMKREWGLPEKQVLLRRDRHWWITLDYRNGINPTVKWIDVECEEEKYIADCFEAFFNSLVSADQFAV